MYRHEIQVLSSGLRRRDLATRALLEGWILIVSHSSHLLSL